MLTSAALWPGVTRLSSRLVTSPASSARLAAPMAAPWSAKQSGSRVPMSSFLLRRASWHMVPFTSVIRWRRSLMTSPFADASMMLRL